MKQRSKEELVLLAILILVVINLLNMVGCTSTKSFEQEYQESIDLENWRACKAAYDSRNHATIHRNHSHSKGISATAGDVKDDLIQNRCKSILRDSWATGIIEE